VIASAFVKDFSASTTFRVEYGETDGQGRVFYVNYWRFFDRGRCAYWMQLGLSEKEIRHIEHATVMVDVHCTYRAPAVFWDLICVRTRIAQLGRSSLRMEFAVVNDSTQHLMAEGYAILVNVDLDSNKSVPFPAEFKAKVKALEGHLLDD
jgi:acyl-CoA thioester hydrolase